MATITGYTAARMKTIEDGTIVSATYDASGHLILTRHDGTQIDVGVTTAATTAQSGIIELATNAEVQAGTDAVRAVTPAGLASLPGYRAQIIAQNSIAETATPGSWPYAVSMMAAASGSGWSLNGGVGTVITNSISVDRTEQTFYAANGGTVPPATWFRTYHSNVGGGGWTAWVQINATVNLAVASFTQATALATYPLGMSRLYYTTSNSTGWDFTGLTGEVTTYKSDGNYGHQTFVQHSWGNTNTPEVWHRTSDNVTGWSAWKKTLHDPGAWLTYTPTWSTTSGLHLPSFGNATVNMKAYKIARKVDVQFDIAFGSTTNFGATPASTDNWTLSLPPAWPASGTAPGTFLGIGDMYRDKSNLGFTRIKMTGTTSVSFGVMTTFVAGVLDATAGHIGGDVDSITPWTWQSGDVFRGTFTYESAS